MTGILKKHGDDNYLDNRYDRFEERLAAGEFPIKALPPHLMYGSVCVNCDETVTALRYHGRRIDLHENNGYWILHQCPHPFDIGVEEGHPEPSDDEIEEELKLNQWSDTGDDQDRRQFDDPKYSFEYPDVPYVAPWK